VFGQGEIFGWTGTYKTMLGKFKVVVGVMGSQVRVVVSTILLPQLYRA